MGGVREGDKNRMPGSSTPRSREGELSVGRNDNILDEMGVTLESLLGLTILSALLAGEVPHEKGLVCTSSRCGGGPIMFHHSKCVEGRSKLCSSVPLEADKIMSLFSVVVAMLLTQLVWPLRMPLRLSASPIVWTTRWRWTRRRKKERRKRRQEKDVA